MQDERDIPLRELILRFRAWRSELFRGWRWPVFLALALGLAGFAFAWFSPVSYVATTTFMLEDDASGGLGALSGVLGRFGLNSGESSETLQKIVVLSKSFTIVTRTLFERKSIGGEEDLLANHLIRAQHLHENEWAASWRDRKRGFTLKDFYFTRSNLDSLDRKEQAALKSLYYLIVGSPAIADPMMTASVDENSGILSVSIKTRKEQVSLNFNRTLFQKLNEFYVSSAIQKQKETYEILRAKSDSIENQLKLRERKAAAFSDQNNQLLFETDRVPGQQYQREKATLGLMLGEAVKNTELADFALRNQIPFVTVIDLPYPPLPTQYRKPVLYTAFGVVAGLMLGFLIVVFRKIYRDAMAGPG